MYRSSRLLRDLEGLPIDYKHWFAVTRSPRHPLPPSSRVFPSTTIWPNPDTAVFSHPIPELTTIPDISTATTATTASTTHRYPNHGQPPAVGSSSFSPIAPAGNSSASASPHLLATSQLTHSIHLPTRAVAVNPLSRPSGLCGVCIPLRWPVVASELLSFPIDAFKAKSQTTRGPYPMSRSPDSPTTSRGRPAHWFHGLNTVTSENGRRLHRAPSLTILHNIPSRRGFSGPFSTMPWSWEAQGKSLSKVALLANETDWISEECFRQAQQFPKVPTNQSTSGSRGMRPPHHSSSSDSSSCCCRY